MKKIALVTGSIRGIGKATVMSLLEHDWFVIVSDITEKDALGEAFDDFKAYDCDYKKCDITNEADVEDMAQYIKATYGRLDLLVNNAGIAPKVRMNILEVTKESFNRVVDCNMKGTFFMCQRFANLMLEFKAAGVENYSPRIVNISSCSSYTSSPNRGEYCVSKAGISMVTKLFADELAKHDIPVFEVRPGIIKSDMTATVLQKYEEMIANGLTPTQRMGTPEDVAKCVTVLASGMLDFSTGQEINADGGFHLRRL